MLGPSLRMKKNESTPTPLGINHLTTRNQNVAYFTCASRETRTLNGYTCCQKYVQLKYLSQWKCGEEGVDYMYMLSSVKWQGRVCEIMSRTKFAE